jgi:hypothetical protein
LGEVSGVGWGQVSETSSDFGKGILIQETSQLSLSAAILYKQYMFIRPPVDIRK